MFLEIFGVVRSIIKDEKEVQTAHASKINSPGPNGIVSSRSCVAVVRTLPIDNHAELI